MDVKKDELRRRPIVSNKSTKVSKSRTSGVRVNGTLTGVDRSLAIVDGEYYSPGDEVSGMKLIEISPDGVIFERSGKRSFVEAAR